ncbi:MAG: selenocysteine-specific translation elongation factor, partial [Candidatus Methylomirabilales bacterium]
IDLVILVIAADEGVMPQTREHLAICELLKVKRGLVALTKVDLVDEEWLELVRADVKEHLKGTFLEGAPMVPVSSTTSQGLDELVQTLDLLAREVPPKRTDGLFRLPIDRAFIIKGFGTVVTGTLWSGMVKVGDEVVILPKGLKTRIRRLQVHGRTVEVAYAGQRTAANLPGIEANEVERGDLLCFPDTLQPTMSFDATLSLLRDAPRPLRNRTRVRFHLGTSEILARVILLDREELLPGEEAYVHLRLESPTAALPKDRYVIRSYSPIMTIGGGMILDPNPPSGRRPKARILEHLKTLEQGSPKEQVEEVLLSAGFVPLRVEALQGKVALDPSAFSQVLEELLREDRAVATGEGYLHRKNYEGLIHQVLTSLQEFHAQHPLKDGISKEELRMKLPPALSPGVFARLLSDLSAGQKIVTEKDKVRLASHEIRLSQEEEAIKAKLEGLYQRAGFQPPDQEAALREVGGTKALAVFQRLVDDGVLVKIKEDLYLHREAYERAKALLLDYLKTRPSISVPTFKDLLGISRKYAIPYLEHFDSVRVTRRQGDERVPY